MPISYSVFKDRKNLLAIPRSASSLFGDLVGGPGARPSQKKHVKILSGDNRDGMDRKDCQLLSRSYTDGFFTDSGHCLS